MQVTIEITQEEYKQLENHVKKAVMMDSIGFRLLTIVDRIAGKVYLAVGKKAHEEKSHEQQG